MRSRLFLSTLALATLATASSARAEEPRYYLAATSSAASDYQLSADLGGEFAARFARRWWGHASIRVGGAMDAEGGGDHLEVRVGVDHERCNASGRLCGLAGIDLGYQASTWDHGDFGPVEHHSGLLAAPHLGLDMGGQRLRLRLLAEGRAYLHHSETPTKSSTRLEPGVGLSAALAYRF